MLRARDPLRKKLKYNTQLYVVVVVHGSNLHIIHNIKLIRDYTIEYSDFTIYVHISGIHYTVTGNRRDVVHCGCWLVLRSDASADTPVYSGVQLYRH